MISARSVAAVAVALAVSAPFSAQAPAGDKEGVRLAALDYDFERMKVLMLDVS